MSKISVRQLFIDNAEKLAFAWIAGQGGANNVLSYETDTRKNAHSLIGHLNFIHANSIQVLGAAEIAYLEAQTLEEQKHSIERLFTAETQGIIVANGLPVPVVLQNFCELHQVPLLTSPEQSPHLMEVLRFYMAKTLAVSTNLHGVFLDVLEIGVLITGDSGMGKSELALELISRGHGLVADDIVEFYRITPDTLEGRCPALLKDFLEVRGLGVLNMRTIFGETAVRPKKNLKLIIHMTNGVESFIDRLQMNAEIQEVLGVPIRKINIPVAAGRNLAVLVEAAVRNYIVQRRGIDSTREFIERQQHMMGNN